MRRFEEQVVVVTGASRGIGRAIAEAFGREGAHVVVNYRADGTGAQETGRRIVAGGGKVTLVQADVSVAGDVERLVEDVERDHGPIEALVNNAGVVVRKGFLQTTEADFDWQFATNVKGLFLMSHAVSRRMTLRRRGSIVNVSSVDGAVAEENRAIYGASKGAVSMLTRGMALDLVSYGIRVNAIAPGVISMDLPAAARYPSFATSLDAWMPMKRLGRPEDCAGAVLFLCSEEASYITGHVLAVDGGLGIRQPLPFPS